MRTQVGIVGAGPAGLLLSLLLQRAGVDSVVLEARSREHVESRVRAGVLEQGTVDLIDDLDAGARLHRESMPDPRLDIRFSGGVIAMDLPKLTPGRIVTVYGQQEVVKDLIATQLARGGTILFEAEAAHVESVTSPRPTIHFRHDGRNEALECDVVAGCDGFHGVCRAAMPEGLLSVYDHILPFAWLGILSESIPFPEMTYSHHQRGFSLASRRGPSIARLYVQCGADDQIEQWPDTRIWEELHVRLYDRGDELKEGRIFQKDVIPVRAFVAAPMQYGRLYLAGDAAHIVPPTGAKGLNLAAADVRLLARAMIEFFRVGSAERLDRYSELCLKRVWKIVRYSNYMTSLLHRFETHSPFERRVQQAELEYLAGSVAGRTTIAENYVGLPFDEE
jgi:p-hydroxybenzoate 3-monooxygenase